MTELLQASCYCWAGLTIDTWDIFMEKYEQLKRSCFWPCEMIKHEAFKEKQECFEPHRNGRGKVSVMWFLVGDFPSTRLSTIGYPSISSKPEASPDISKAANCKPESKAGAAQPGQPINLCYRSGFWAWNADSELTVSQKEEIWIPDQLSYYASSPGTLSEDPDFSTLSIRRLG